jgi:hypothetical protein
MLVGKVQVEDLVRRKSQPAHSRDEISNYRHQCLASHVLDRGIDALDCEGESLLMLSIDRMWVSDDIVPRHRPGEGHQVGDNDPDDRVARRRMRNDDEGNEELDD